jgi:hypothetical protein
MDMEKVPPPYHGRADQTTTQVVAMAINPYLVHVYWQISEMELKAIRHALLKGGRPVLRFYDITCILFDGTNAHQTFDVEVDLRTMKWNVPLWSTDKSYLIDLGYEAADGRFFQIARSNIVNLPRAAPSTRFAERYLRVERGRIRSLSPVIVHGGPYGKPVETVPPDTLHGVGKDPEMPLKGELGRLKTKDSARAEYPSKGPTAAPCHISELRIPAEQNPVYKGAYSFDMVHLTQEKFFSGVSSPSQGKNP